MPLARPPPGPLLTETMRSPGAATPSQGPAMVKSDGRPLAATDPADNTKGCHHDGTDTEVTLAQSPAFDSHAAPSRTLPAAATITASFCTAAYFSAAPSSV